MVPTIFGSPISFAHLLATFYKSFADGQIFRFKSGFFMPGTQKKHTSLQELILLQGLQDIFEVKKCTFQSAYGEKYTQTHLIQWKGHYL